MITKVILVIMMSRFNYGMALDHIEFKTMSQCDAAKIQLEKEWPNSVSCSCVEVRNE